MPDDPELRRLETEAREALTARAALTRRAADDSAITVTPEFKAEWAAAEARLKAANAAVVKYKAGH